MKKLLKHTAIVIAATIAASSAGVAAFGTAVNASFVVAPLALASVWTHDKKDIKKIKHHGNEILNRFKSEPK